METFTETLENGLIAHVEIQPDLDPENPRNEWWDNFGTMVCFHRRYDLGDEHNLSVEEAKKLAGRKDVISLPLYLYDHSGITMRTSPFSCPWDSGQVGFIYVTLEKVRKEYGVKRVSKELRQKVKNILSGEVETYDQYLTGDVWGYDVTVKDQAGNEVASDSCWGFYGLDYCREAAREVVKYHAEQTAKGA